MRRALLLACALASCGRPQEPLSDDERARILSLSPLPSLPESPESPVADDEEAAELGRALFYDPRLSASSRTSCSSCHDPAAELTDGRPMALARGRVGRNTPTLRGSAWMRWQTWDGRKDSVWAQALAPLEDDAEHATTRAEVARVVARHHEARWSRVFGPLPPDLAPERLTSARPVPGAPDHPHARAWAAMSAAQRAAVEHVFVRVGFALEAYLRRLDPGEAPLDRYVEALRRGDETGAGAMSEAAVRGLRAFVGPARCFDCHHGPLLSDGEFHNLGLPPAIGVPDDDRGRADGARALLEDPHRCASERCAEVRHLDPTRPELVGAFRTPPLRNVARTAPYMHGGHLATLDDVLQFYRTLPGRAAVGHRDELLAPLPRGVRASDLRAFLEALSGRPPEARWLRP